MRPDGLDHSRDFLLWKPKSLQELWRLFARISDMVPFGQFGQRFRTMSDEYAQVMHPRRGVKHIVVVRASFGQTLRKMIKPWLMTELVGRKRVLPDISLN